MKKFIIKLLILVLIIQTSFNLIDMINNVSNAVTKIYVEKGSTTTITANSSDYTIEDTSIASATSDFTIKAQLGTTSSYNGDKVELSSCEYTWTDAGRGNGTYYATKGNLYLYLYYSRNNSYVNGTATSPLTVANNNGNFTIHYNSSDYLSFNTTNNYFTATNRTGTAVNLYRKTTNGETSSTEIPGYIKVTQIEEETNYLVVKENGGNYYVLYPVQKANNGNTNYSETGKIINKYEYTITGNEVGTTTMTIGDEEYTITVYGENEEIELEAGDEFTDKALIITQGSSYTLQENISGTVTWSSSNTSIATVSRNGQVTAASTGTTTIKATSGNVTYNIKVTVVPRLTTEYTYNTRIVNIHIDCDDETTLYYNLTYGTDFIEAHDGTRVYIQVPRSNGWGGFFGGDTTYNYINFFAVPDDGYALSYMSGWYAPIVEETQSEVQNGRGPYLISTTQNEDVTNATKATAVGTAYSMGAEGMFGYTADGTEDVTQTFTVRSEKLPKISQKIYSINGNNYKDGDVAHPGEEVIFEVTLSKGAYDYVVNYDGTLTNSLSGATFLGTSPTGTGTSTSQTVNINSKGSVSQKYYIKYTIPENETEDVTNTVTFNYESYGNPSTSNRTGYVNSNASYKADRTGNASTTVTVKQKVIQAKSYITLTKEIAGNMRETDKYFKFLVNIDGTSGESYTILGQDNTVIYNNSQISTSSTYTVGSTNYVYLKGGQTVIIGLSSDETTSEIPEGTTYSIIEQDAEDYATTISGIQGETKTTGNMTVGEINTVEFLNSKDAAALTGGVFEIAVYAIIFVSSILGANIVIRKKYKNR